MKFKRAFLMNPNFRFETEKIRQVADELIYVCDTPMFDNLIGQNNRRRFEDKIASAMADFDFENDVIVVYGDPIIMAIMIMFACIMQSPTEIKPINIARWSASEDKYLVRQISEEFFPEETVER